MSMRRLRRRLSVVLVATLMLMTGLTIGTTAKDKITLAFTCPNLNPAYQAVLWGLRSVIQKDGRVNLVIGAPELETDVAKQLNMIEDFIQQRVDALAVCSMADAVMGNYIEKANKAGIPVFAFNTPKLWPRGEVVSNIGFDQREAGRIMARYAVEHYLKDGGKVAIIEGMPGIFTDFRAGGIVDVLSNTPNIKVVARQAADWDRVKAMRVTENIITAHPDVKVIFTICDEMGLGAVAALQAAGVKERIAVVSHDATFSGLQSIRDGGLDATVNVNNIQWGIELGKAVIDYVINHKEVPKVINVDLPMVDKTNVTEYIQRAEFFQKNYSF